MERGIEQQRKTRSSETKDEQNPQQKRQKDPAKKTKGSIYVSAKTTTTTATTTKYKALKGYVGRPGKVISGGRHTTGRAIYSYEAL